MGSQLIPITTGGGIKLIQRGQAVSAGDITITAVNTAKTFVESFSEGASGTVALTGSTTGTLSPSGGDTSGSGDMNSGLGVNQASNQGGTSTSYTGTRTLSGGTMDATTGSMGAYLTNSTTLTATGACRYQVVEFA